MIYLNFKSYSIIYHEDSHSFSCLYRTQGSKEECAFIKKTAIMVTTYQDTDILLSSYKNIDIKKKSTLESNTLSVLYSGGAQGTPDLELTFTINSSSLSVQTFARAIVKIKGSIIWGENAETSTFGVRLNSKDSSLRTACGPAFSMHDNALFDRQTDRVLEFKAPDKFHVFYDWKNSGYSFEFASGFDFGRSFSFKIHENYFAQKFNIPYTPIDKGHGFKTPPVGWMTWYATQFKASEEVVLKNAHLLKEKFSGYCDKLCVWVDWEWNHKTFDGLGQGGVNTFIPRPEAYPNGLARVAEQIKSLGLIPAIWVGATNDGQLNYLLKQHPEWLLAQKPEWCGQYWVDPSHPEVVNTYIPAVFQQILAWGYNMVKWDCLPITMNICDLFHHQFYNSSLSTDTALRDLVQAARKVIGADTYMLSCSGETDRDITFAMDSFSAARIGGDIFGWEDFVNNAIIRILHYYTWHNISFYADADNLVLREEFNTLEQARSRVSLYGLTGLPVTIGDEISVLDDERINMLRKIISVSDIHPMDLQHKRITNNYTIVNLIVCREFGEWNVVGITNTADDELSLLLSLESDLHITTRSSERYAVYDFWNDRFLGIYTDKINISIDPFDTTVLRITNLTNHPEVISSSRHITQGAIELRKLNWNNETSILSSEIECIENEQTCIIVYLPDDYVYSHIESNESTEVVIDKCLMRINTPAKSCNCHWSIYFLKSGASV